MQAIMGKKLGMTQIYEENGAVVPVTVIKAGPCLIVQRKSAERDGVERVQIGLVEDRPAKNVTQPMVGHFKKAGVAPMRRLAEVEVAADSELTPGDEVNVSIFQVDDYVDVSGTSKGKGFQGVVKRHGFRGGGASHGSMFHRRPGSIGQASDPSRVFPGMRLPGRMGGDSVTVKNLTVVKVDEAQSLLFLRGAVPGVRNGVLTIRKAKRGT